MKVGTKSVLFGAHCFFIHPWFVMAAWIKLYGFPLHPAIWLSFFFHDLGYWGKPNMDGHEGETHVELGAKVLGFLFDKHRGTIKGIFSKSTVEASYKWENFSRYHSRFYAKKDGVNPSRLCVADKLAIALEPSWLYIPRANWSGEINEYMALAKKREEQGEKLNMYEAMKLSSESQNEWFQGVKDYMIRWVDAHKNDQTDHWTPSAKIKLNDNGVWI